MDIWQHVSNAPVRFWHGHMSCQKCYMCYLPIGSRVVQRLCHVPSIDWSICRPTIGQWAVHPLGHMSSFYCAMCHPTIGVYVLHWMGYVSSCDLTTSCRVSRHKSSTCPLWMCHHTTTCAPYHHHILGQIGCHMELHLVICHLPTHS